MTHALTCQSGNRSARTLMPWFLAPDGAPSMTQCCCDCAWTSVLTALQGAGPVAVVLPGLRSATEALSVLAAGLALGAEWTLCATISNSGVDESLHWRAAGRPMAVHALPSSNWRPFDRLARQHACPDRHAATRRVQGPAVAVPLLVDADYRLQLLAWSNLTRLDQEHGQEWMTRTRIHALLP